MFGYKACNGGASIFKKMLYAHDLNFNLNYMHFKVITKYIEEI